MLFQGRVAFNKKNRRLSFLCIACAMFFLGNIREAGSRSFGQQERYHVKVQLVLVDVIVTKAGEFCRDLKAGDFELYDDGVEVAVNSCELILSGAPPSGQPSKVAVGDKTVSPKKQITVLLDGINVWQRELKNVLREVTEELADMTKAGTEIMVLYLDRQRGLGIAQPFTNREELLRTALKKAEAELFPPSLEYLDYDPSLSAGRAQAVDPEIGPLRAIEHVNRGVERFVGSVSGLVASFHLLEAIPGRRNLLFVSCGFPDIDNLRLSHDFSPNMAVTIADPLGILGRRSFPNGESVLTEVFRAANARNISIYSLDAGTFSKNVVAGPAAEFFDREGVESRETLLKEKARQIGNLRILSERTGAVILTGAGKVDQLREIMKNDLNQYYQLSFYLPKKTLNGAYHRIEVRVKGQGKYLVRHRDGYSDILEKR